MKKIGLLLIIIGALVASYPIVLQLYDNYQQQKMLDEMTFLDVEVSEGFVALGDTFNRLTGERVGGETDNQEIVIEGFDEFDQTPTDEEQTTVVDQTAATGTPGVTTSGTGTTTATTKAPKPTVKLKALGSIEIPAIKVRLPLVEGTRDVDIVRSAGHMIGTSMPGEVGNSAIAGHRGYSYGRLFNRLGELKIGDTIKVKTRAGTFIYEVYETKIVKPDDLSVLNRNKKDKILTLITCTPMFKSTHRIIIHAIIKE